jgi:hypothetical protein
MFGLYNNIDVAVDHSLRRLTFAGDTCSWKLFLRNGDQIPISSQLSKWKDRLLINFSLVKGLFKHARRGSRRCDLLLGKNQTFDSACQKILRRWLGKYQVRSSSIGIDLERVNAL